ncbi:NYN domain-containing protein [Kribbella sp. NPDC000426]|uniref:NYN domain-containing protein n=1 Tax=Kribbella sp. NPDC000426 TaxID=3154255 RepID=UPI00332B220A
MRINVYIDGFNLYFGSLKGRPYKWLDLERMCGLLLPRFELGRIRYFTALVKERPDNEQAPVRQQAYLRALGTLPAVEVHLGSFLTKPTRMALANPPLSGPRTVEVIKTEEKGSDVNLATYLTEPIRIVRHELGKVVGLLNPQPVPSQRLLTCRPTFAKQIRAGVLGASQFPERVTDGRGSVIRKPTGW